MTRALVTGGGGFLGGAIVRRLLQEGVDVRSLGRGDYPVLADLGVDVSRGDIADHDCVHRAAEDCDVVFHVAAKTGAWGPYEDYHRVNVVGTDNVLSACRRHGIRRLVYTSSPSVIHNGGDLEGVDESIPYPDHFEAAYPETKALAEQRVLAANDAALATVSLRPHLIWGPGDTNLVPRILQRGRAGQLRRLGKEPKLVDTIYIDNAAEAHWLAAQRLDPGGAIAGKAYFIAQGEPIPLWDMIDRILDAGGLPPVRRHIPVKAAYAIGAMLEAWYRVWNITSEPRMTRFIASQLSTAHWFDLTAARRDLGFEPAVSLEEGLRRLKEWLQMKAEG